MTPNILHIDIDSLRADHLGCYGYHRNTSPNIDRVASEGVRFTDCWISDAPCLPSRTALWSGQVGWRNGVVNHTGSRASLRSEGSSRSYHDRVGLRGFTPILRDQGYRTATVSSFGDRHAAWHWYAGFGEIMDTGGRGMETADVITSRALDWLGRNGSSSPWYLHVNYWDPHTPYRTPADFGDPFADERLPAWLTEDVLERSRRGWGGHSARDLHGFDPEWADSMREYPRVPLELETCRSAGRDYIVASQGAWTCQRGVRFGRHLLLVTFHDAYKDLPRHLLFDTTADPHEEHDLAAARPDLLQDGLLLLDRFSAELAPLPDPLETVTAEGGGAHCRGELPAYAEHLRLTERSELADRLVAAHPAEARETVGSTP